MENKPQSRREPTTPSDLERTLATRFLAVAADAEQLGFLRAPEPECLGRPDTQCTAEGHGHGEAHEHEREHGHEYGHGHQREHAHGDQHEHAHGQPHEHPAAEEPEHAHGHEHMRVFPVFVVNPEGQLEEVVTMEGKVTDAARKLRRADEAKPGPDETPSERSPGKTARKSNS